MFKKICVFSTLFFLNFWVLANAQEGTVASPSSVAPPSSTTTTANPNIFDENLNTANQNQNVSYILKPKFQINLKGQNWKELKLRNQVVEVWYLDAKKQRIWSCVMEDGSICSMDLRNKNADGLTGSFGILIDWKPIDKLISFDFTTDKNSNLEYSNSNIVHAFLNIDIHLDEISNNKQVYFIKYETKSGVESTYNETNVEINNKDQQGKISWEVDQLLWPWYVEMIDNEGKRVWDGYLIKENKDWTFVPKWEYTIKPHLFEVGKAYTLRYTPNQRWVLTSWKTFLFSSVGTMKTDLDWTKFSHNVKYTSTQEPPTPYFSLIIIWLFWVIVYVWVERFWIRGLWYIRWDRREQGKIID